MKPPFFLPLLVAASLLPALPATCQVPAPSPTPSPSPTPVLDPNHPLSSVLDETKDQRDKRMAWWRDAKFGMFIHWGVYSVPAGSYHNAPVAGLGEWIMSTAKIPMAEYQSYAKEFNPVEYDAAKFVAAAKSAGMKYIVITAKHHDGFALFDSKASDWSIVKASPYGKDLLKPLAEECRKQGIKLGFYYSHSQDWNNGGYVLKPHWDPAQSYRLDDYIEKIVLPQMTELLTNYGSDTPAYIWWDTPYAINPARAAKIDGVIQKLRPGVIQNNRLIYKKELENSKFFGDLETPEQNIPPQGFPGRDWETCMTMNGTWGFKTNDHNWKSTETLMRNLCDIASKGGNYLLNVGPDPKGNIPAESLKTLAEMGAWMKINGEAVYGSTGSPFGSEFGTPTEKNGKAGFKVDWKWRATQKPGHIYLHVFTWPANGTFSVPAFAKKITQAKLLASASENLTVTQNDQGITISGLPAKAPDAIASVIDLRY